MSLFTFNYAGEQQRTLEEKGVGEGEGKHVKIKRYVNRFTRARVCVVYRLLFPSHIITQLKKLLSLFITPLKPEILDGHKNTNRKYKLIIGLLVIRANHHARLRYSHPGW